MGPLQFPTPCWVRTALCITGPLLLIAQLAFAWAGVHVPWNASLVIGGFALGGLRLAFGREATGVNKPLQEKTPAP